MARLGITDAIAFDATCRVRAIRPVVGIALRRGAPARIQHNKKQLEVGSWLLG